MKRFLVFVAAFLIPLITSATETLVTIRVKAHDAKFIGSAVGGLKVVLKDFYTGKVLAEGTIEGGTGNTKLIMESPPRPIKNISKGAAKFVAKIDIDEPTKVEASVTGPLGAGCNIQKASKTFWVIPGENIEGDGVILEIPGFIVTVRRPAPHEFYKLGSTIKIDAYIAMMCGCPIKPGGLWDANRIKVKAVVKKGNKVVAEIPLKFKKGIGNFGGVFKPTSPGGYKVIVTASDTKANNFGVAYTGFVVTAPKK